MKLFNDPQSPFELEHNQQALQDRVRNGRLLAFRHKGGCVYATPNKAFEALTTTNGEQMTADELAAHHAEIMQKMF
jgi:hypothetical protein